MEQCVQACHWAIDELKAKVPIWKKELYEDGEAWKENAEFVNRVGRADRLEQ
jgi:molybdopterin synthase catalytic subunit